MAKCQTWCTWLDPDDDGDGADGASGIYSGPPVGHGLGKTYGNGAGKLTPLFILFILERARHSEENANVLGFGSAMDVLTWAGSDGRGYAGDCTSFGWLV